MTLLIARLSRQISPHILGQFRPHSGVGFALIQIKILLGFDDAKMAAPPALEHHQKNL
jgi:hypothetical protein